MRLRQLTAAFVAFCFLGLGLQSTASAGVIGTTDFLAAQTRAGNLADVNAALNREDVRAQLIALGVDPAAAASRVAALSDSELAEVAHQVNTLPAGGDGLLAVIGIVFIVLIILDLTGVTHVFRNIR